MRFSQMFGETLREAPADAEVTSHQLLLRGGFIHRMGAGIFSYLPLGWRVVQKISAVIREEIESIGGQELLMPVVNPGEIWKASGRWATIGPELTRFTDRNARDMVLAMTHEEAVSDLVRHQIRSYRQLPRLLFHLQTKWRDDPRPRAGLIRVREFIMKDSYSLDKDEAGLDLQYRHHYQAYHRIFARCGLDALAVRSDVGMMGGQMAHEFMYLTPVGEDTIMICGSCGMTANRQVAAFGRDAPGDRAETSPLLEAEEVATPGAATIADLAEFLGVEPRRTAKAVFMMGEIDDETETLLFAVIRGDLDVNETKLANAAGVRSLRPARPEEIADTGAVPGYASPVGVTGVRAIVDESVRDTPNLVAGANRKGYHLRNVNLGRDFDADVIADIAMAWDGAPCPECGSPLSAKRGVELGNIFKLGTRYSDSMGCEFLDEQGIRRPVVMGSYGIGVGRLLACVAEQSNDSDGLIWPISIAPFQVHLIALTGGEQVAEEIYQQLQDNGFEVLFDDRLDRPGVMFKDADLIGIPIRITVSARSLQHDAIETSVRSAGERVLVPRADSIDWVRSTAVALVSPLVAAAGSAPSLDP